MIATTAMAQVNDMPKVQWNCRESVDGTVVNDGAKTLILAKDRFGILTLNVVQKDQFRGNEKIVDNVIVEDQKCAGFIPCEIYAAKGIHLFINLIPNSSAQQAQLQLGNQAIEFLCKEN
jgi:mannose/fructose/N-acetylgalactosamine-specific phosphotransferase system component IIB